MTCEDAEHNETCRLADSQCEFIFMDSMPSFQSIADVYRESILQIPLLMQAHTDTGVDFGANAYRRWAEDLENGRYASCAPEDFESWGDWCAYVCNFATNARHGWDFLAKTYVNNPDMPQILRLLALLDRNEDYWRELEELGAGFNVVQENLCYPDKRQAIAQVIRKFISLNEEMLKLF